MRWIKYFLIFISCPLFANVPGGIATVVINLNSDYPPQAYYQDRRVLIIPKDNVWEAVVGIPLSATPGEHSLLVIHDTQHIEFKFIVEDKNYPSEKITIKDKNKAEPHEESQQLIVTQQAEILATYANWREDQISSLRLKLPVAGRFSSPFGFKRIINNIAKNPHSGLDIAAAKGTKVHAAKSGIITNVAEYFYSGKIVFIDHGQSFITSYCHLDTINVSKGQSVEQGAVIGTVGNTGRATGPHLHWSVSLNNARVDPELFIDE